MGDEVTCNFDWSLWRRIKAACRAWWAIVVYKKLTVFDDFEGENA